MPRDTPPPVPRQVKKPVEPVEAQITYSSAPVLRDFKKEATKAKLAPAAVKRNIQRGKGGGLMEEEEWERLEKAGYAADQKEKKPEEPKAVQVEEVEDDGT